MHVIIGPRADSYSWSSEDRKGTYLLLSVSAFRRSQVMDTYRKISQRPEDTRWRIISAISSAISSALSCAFSSLVALHQNHQNSSNLHGYPDFGFCTPTFVKEDHTQSDWGIRESHYLRFFVGWPFLTENPVDGHHGFRQQITTTTREVCNYSYARDYCDATSPLTSSLSIFIKRKCVNENSSLIDENLVTWLRY